MGSFHFFCHQVWGTPCRFSAQSLFMSILFSDILQVTQYFFFPKAVCSTASTTRQQQQTQGRLSISFRGLNPVPRAFQKSSKQVNDNAQVCTHMYRITEYTYTLTHIWRRCLVPAPCVFSEIDVCIPSLRWPTLSALFGAQLALSLLEDATRCLM